MTERASGGNDITEKQSEAQRREDVAQAGNENKAQDGATESIAVVKSKIREKNAVQAQQEDEAYGNTKAAKVVSSKISKLAKQKRGKSKSNEALDTQENATDDIKTENVPPQDLNISTSQYAQNESKTTLDMSSIVSKKSLLSKKSVAKSASRLIALTEDDDNAENVTSNVTSKISIGGNYENDETQSAFVISHDAESQRENTINNVLENLTDIHPEIIQRLVPPPVHVHERGNYMTSVAPSPIEDYPPPSKEQIEQKEKERREQRELREMREQKERELKEIKEKEQRELRELKEREQRELKELREQRELKELREQKELRDIRDQKDLRDVRELREKDPREPAEAKDVRDPREPREVKEAKEPREAREARDTREAREHREIREARDLRDIREHKEPREQKEQREPKDQREYKTQKEEEDK